MLSPHGLPGALPADGPTPTSALSIQQINIRDEANRQAVSDRLDAQGRGFDSVFGQPYSQ